MCVFVYMCTYVHVYMSGVQRIALMSQLPPTMWVPGIRLGGKGLYLELSHRPSIFFSKFIVLYLEYFQFPICSAGPKISSSLAMLTLLWVGISTKHHSERRVGSGREVWLWKLYLAQGGCFWELHHSEHVGRISHKRLLLSTGGRYVKVWDMLKGGQLLVSLKNHHKTVTCLCLSSSGQRLLSGSLDR